MINIPKELNSNRVRSDYFWWYPKNRYRLNTDVPLFFFLIQTVFMLPSGGYWNEDRSSTPSLFPFYCLLMQTLNYNYLCDRTAPTAECVSADTSPLYNTRVVIVFDSEVDELPVHLLFIQKNLFHFRFYRGIWEEHL